MASYRVFLPMVCALAILAAFSPVEAHSASLCLKSVLKNGKITLRKRLVAEGVKCPSGYTSILTTTEVSTVGLQGPQGIQGPPGEQGPPGPVGGFPNLTVVVAESAADSTSAKQAGASCPAGYVGVSGGGGVLEGLYVPAPGPVAIGFSGFTISPTPTWLIRAFETEPYANNWRVWAYVMCRPQ